MKILYRFIAFTCFIFFSTHLKADCTITSTINANVFLATYGGCTGTMTIPSGVDLVMNASLTLPSGVNRLVIASGGQIIYNTNNVSLILADGAILDILNTSPSSSSDANAAIYSSGSCNNTKDMYIGATKYSACTGGGNVCILFSDLVAAGGTAEPSAGVTAGSTVNGSNACYPFGLNVSVTGAGTIISYLWTQTSGPGTATISNASTANPTISSATLTGSYTFNVAVVVSAIPQGSNCTSNAQITVNNSITLSIYIPIVATGGGTPQIAAGDSYTLVGGNVTVTGTSPSYSWTENGAGFISSGAATLTPTYSSNNPLDKGNTVVLTLTASNPGCSASANFNILVRTKLPITLQEFTGKSSNCSNELQWKVADAKNFKEFEIEHSKTGTEFNTITSIQAKAETRNEGLNQIYSFTDNINKSKNQFYRLKLIDLDGSFKFSPVISVANECLTPTVGLYPNPLKKVNDIQIELSNFGEKIQGKLIDLTGRTIQSFKLNNGINKIQVDPFVHGIYWFALKDELNNEKVVKLSVIK